MAIVNSYVCLPEGRCGYKYTSSLWQFQPGTFSACPNFRAALSADVLNVVPSTKMRKRNGGFDHSISKAVYLIGF